MSATRMATFWAASWGVVTTTISASISRAAATMVATGSPEATRAAVGVLESGGNDS